MLKNILISLTSIMGVFLALFLTWNFVLNDEPQSNPVTPDVQAAEALVEENQADSAKVAEPEQQTLVRSELKIVNVE